MMSSFISYGENLLTALVECLLNCDSTSIHVFPGVPLNKAQDDPVTHCKLWLWPLLRRRGRGRCRRRRRCSWAEYQGLWLPGERLGSRSPWCRFPWIRSHSTWFPESSIIHSYRYWHKKNWSSRTWQLKLMSHCWAFNVICTYSGVSLCGRLA